MFFGKPILSFETQITPFGEPNIFFGVHSYTGFNDAVESYIRKIDHPVPLTDRSIDDLKLLLLKAEKQDMIADKTAKIIVRFLKKRTPFCKVNFQQILFHILTRIPRESSCLVKLVFIKGQVLLLS